MQGFVPNLGVPSYGNQGPPSGGFNQCPPSGGFNQGPPPTGGFNQGPPPTNFNQGPPTGGFNQGPPPTNFNQGPPTGGFNQGPPPTGFNQGPPTGGFNQGPPPTGGFNQGPPPTRGYNQGPPPTRGFNQGPQNHGPPPTGGFNNQAQPNEVFDITKGSFTPSTGFNNQSPPTQQPFNNQRPPPSRGFNQGPHNQGHPPSGGFNQGPPSGGFNLGSPNQGPPSGGFNQGPPPTGGFNQGPPPTGFNNQGPHNQGPPPTGGFNQGPPPTRGFNQGPPPTGGFNQPNGQHSGGYPQNQQGGYQSGGYPPQSGGYAPQSGGYPSSGFPPQTGGFPPPTGGFGTASGVQEYVFNIRVIGARNLTAADKNGKSDPYCLVTPHEGMSDKKDKKGQKTKVQRKTLNPTWDETFTFSISSVGFADYLINLDIFDWDRFGHDDAIGGVQLNLASLRLCKGQECEMWLKLVGRDCGAGELKVGITSLSVDVPVYSMTSTVTRTNSRSSQVSRSRGSRQRVQKFYQPKPPQQQQQGTGGSIFGNSNARSLVVGGQKFTSDIEPLDLSEEALYSSKYNPNHAYWCVLCANLAYRTGPEIDKICTEIWGMTETVFFDDAETDTQGFGMYCDQFCLICFRGTESSKDWMTNLKFTAVTPFDEHREIKVHSGFNYACCTIINDVKRFIAKARQQDYDLPLFLTGHSLGGALANLCFAYCSFFSNSPDKLEQARREGKKKAEAEVLIGDPSFVGFHQTLSPSAFSPIPVTAVYTFGQPRVGNWELVSLLSKSNPETPFFRVTNNNDVVPNVPANKLYQHCGERIFVSPDRIFVQGDKQAKSFRNQLRKKQSQFQKKKSGVGDHLSGVYWEVVENHYNSYRELRLSGSQDNLVIDDITGGDRTIEQMIEGCPGLSLESIQKARLTRKKKKGSC